MACVGYSRAQLKTLSSLFKTGSMMGVWQVRLLLVLLQHERLPLLLLIIIGSWLECKRQSHDEPINISKHYFIKFQFLQNCWKLTDWAMYCNSLIALWTHWFCEQIPWLKLCEFAGHVIIIIIIIIIISSL